MGRQAGRRTGARVVYTNETGNRQAGSTGGYLNETATGSNSQTITVSAVGSVGVKKGSAKLVGVVVAGVVVALKAVHKALSFAAAAVVTTSAGRVFTKTLTVAVTATAGLGKKVVAKIVAVSSAVAAVISNSPHFLGGSGVNHTQAVSTACAATVKVLHSWAIRVVTGCSTAVSVACRTTYARLVAVMVTGVARPTYHSAKTLQATGGVSVSMPPIWKQVFKRFPSLPVGAVVLTSRSPGKLVRPTVTTTVSMIRYVGHTVSALPALAVGIVKHCTHTLSWAVTVSVNAFPGSGHLQVIAVAVSTQVTVARMAAYLRAIAATSTIAVTVVFPRTVVQLVAVASTTLVTLSRAIGKSVLSAVSIGVSAGPSSTAVPRPFTGGSVTVTWRQGRRDILKG